MSIKLYDTMTRQLQVVPAKTELITMYTCGPTVYDDPHIGNWRTFILYDTLRRTLEEVGDYQVNHVLNITDVGHLVSDEDEGEDKLVKAARTARKTAWDVASYYTQRFVDGMEQLNLLPPTHMPKATDLIPEQIALVQKLEAKGMTYTIDDGVYFETSKLDDYGKLSGQKLDQLKAGARVEFNPQKHAATDFALWKFSSEQEQRDMEWDSPWGKGFPGWHLECSAMALKYLGETIDIHAGGIDHIPVHHTNEIAQSEAATGQKPFAKIWVHTEFLKINEQKIAKSAGNGITLDDVSDKGYDAMDLRLMFLQSHYKTEANFSWENLTAAANRLSSLRELAELRFQPLSFASEDELELIVRTKADMQRQLSDDLNTPQALATLSSAADILTSDGLSQEGLAKFIELIEFIDAVFGLRLMDSTADITDKQKQLVAKRQAARQAKDYEAADTARDQLLADGITINDTPNGIIWHRQPSKSNSK